MNMNKYYVLHPKSAGDYLGIVDEEGNVEPFVRKGFQDHSEFLKEAVAAVLDGSFVRLWCVKVDGNSNWKLFHGGQKRSVKKDDLVDLGSVLFS